MCLNDIKCQYVPTWHHQVSNISKRHHQVSLYTQIISTSANICLNGTSWGDYLINKQKKSWQWLNLKKMVSSVALKYTFHCLYTGVVCSRWISPQRLEVAQCSQCQVGKILIRQFIKPSNKTQEDPFGHQ